MWMSSSSFLHLWQIPFPLLNLRDFLLVQIALYAISQVRQDFFGSINLLHILCNMLVHWYLSLRIFHLWFSTPWIAMVFMLLGIGQIELESLQTKASIKGFWVIVINHISPLPHWSILWPIRFSWWLDKLYFAMSVALDFQYWISISQMYCHDFNPILWSFKASSSYAWSIGIPTSIGH